MRADLRTTEITDDEYSKLLDRIQEQSAKDGDANG